MANNAGEIVFDRFFIESMGGVDVSYVVNCAYAGYAASGQTLEPVSRDLTVGDTYDLSAVLRLVVER